jgi:hypothetical protein
MPPDFLNGGRGNDTLSGNGGTGDFTSDSFIFEGTFGNDVIIDFEIGFDGIIFAVGIDENDITTTEAGDDVLISVDIGKGQSVLVENVAGQFISDIDISIL